MSKPDFINQPMVSKFPKEKKGNGQWLIIGLIEIAMKKTEKEARKVTFEEFLSWKEKNINRYNSALVRRAMRMITCMISSPQELQMR